MGFIASTSYEDVVIAGLIESGDFTGFVTLQRYEGHTLDDGRIHVHMSTNDDNDDGYPDGEWVEDDYRLTRSQFDKHCGLCRVGISGVIVTVMLDGQELHYDNGNQSRRTT